MSKVGTSEVRVGERPRRVIAFDWHGGPISGLVEYGPSTSPEFFHFSLVGGVTGDSRAFLLREAPKGAWTTTLELLEELSPPRWPVWVLNWKIGSPEWRARVDSLLNSITSAQQHAAALVEAETIEDVVTCVRPITNENELQVVEKMLSEDADHDAWVAYCRRS